MSNKLNRIFLDTNICYDIISRREPFYKLSALVFSAMIEEQKTILISALTVVNLHYFLRKDFGDTNARNAVISFKSLCEVHAMDNALLDRAFGSSMRDFEDGVQHFIALRGNAEAIITRDKKGYKKSIIPVYTPEQYLKLYK